MRLTRRIAVVLPQPDGPTRTQMSPGGDDERQALDRRLGGPRVDLRDLAELERGRLRVRRRPLGLGGVRAVQEEVPRRGDGEGRILTSRPGWRGTIGSPHAALRAADARADASSAVVALAGCGGDDGRRPATTPTAHRDAPRRRSRAGPVPPALRTVESAAEDTIDHALAGDRAQGRSHGARAAGGGRRPGPARARRTPAWRGARIEDLRARSAEVARAGARRATCSRSRWPPTTPSSSSPASSRATRAPVPAGVLTLDYLDFEAKLRARAHDDARLRAAS